VSSSEYEIHGTTSQPDVSDRSFGELIGNLTNDFSTLVRKEIELAKVETKEEVTKFGKGAGMLAAAGVAALLMLIFLSMTLMWLLDNWMHTAWAALIVTVLWAIVAGVLAQIGRKRLSEATPPLQETKDTLKEDAQWAKTLKS
jgi:uncharacterized membrane protein YqjE